jgi:hypothetical protein
MVRTCIEALSGLVLIVVLLGGCKTSPSNPYRLIRPESHNGAISNPALYEKAGDTNHVYMQALGSTNLIRLPK